MSYVTRAFSLIEPSFVWSLATSLTEAIEEPIIILQIVLTEPSAFGGLTRTTIFGPHQARNRRHHLPPFRALLRQRGRRGRGLPSIPHLPLSSGRPNKA